MGPVLFCYRFQTSPHRRRLEGKQGDHHWCLLTSHLFPLWLITSSSTKTSCLAPGSLWEMDGPKRKEMLSNLKERLVHRVKFMDKKNVGLVTTCLKMNSVVKFKLWKSKIITVEFYAKWFKIIINRLNTWVSTFVTNFLQLFF